MSKIPNLKQVTIDSCKLSIPLSHLTSYDKSLIEELIVVDKETCSIIEKEFKRVSKKYFFEEFSVYASIHENKRTSLNRFEDCLIILINSKQLGSRYFEGITFDTLPTIFQLVRKLGILDCSYGVFLKASITDIDFKKDYVLEFNNYKELIKGCELMTKPSNNRDKGCTVYSDKMNYGIEWSVRETSKYSTYPFVKIYHKGLELMSDSGSKEFKDRYLSHMDLSNVIRIESTVKNKKHLESLKLGLKYFTINELLHLSQEEMNKIISKSINAHLLPRTKSLSFKTESKMTPTNRIFLNSLIGLTLDADFSFDRALNLLLNGIENDSSKSNNKKVLKRLYFDHVNGTNYEKKSSEVESIFDSIGWF